MRIRDVTTSDFDAIAPLVNHFIEKTAIHFGLRAVTAAELRAEWESTRERFAYVVAEVDGRLAGFAKASSFRARAAYAWTAELGVYVDDAFQRKGVATALYTRVIDVCSRQGFHALIAGIALPNDASVAFHEGLGFQRVGTFPEVGYKLGKFHDVGFWVLLIAPADAPPSPIKTLTEIG